MKHLSLLAALSLCLLPACDQVSELTGGGSQSGGNGGSAGSDAPAQPGQARAVKEQGGVAGAASKLIREGHRNGPPMPEPGVTRDQCDDMTDGGPLAGECLTGVLECGQTITGHTLGGVTQFDTTFYEKKFCTPATTNHDSGNERVYKLHLEEPTVAVVTLDTPCGDLDLFGVQYNESGGKECPTVSGRVRQCEANRKDGTEREQIRLNTFGDWLVVVEGVDDHEGAFSLTVQCGTWF